MGKPCAVCTHPDRATIDERLVSGAPYRAVGADYGMSKDSVRRHADAHVPAAIVAARDVRVIEHGRTLLDRVEELERRARAILDNAESAHVQLGALRELRSIVELLGKVTGELRDSPQLVVNVLGSSEWQSIQRAMFDALAAFPDARLAVAERLQALEAGS